ncbi:MAG: serine/threonine-protein kinase [Actinomycetota bacterium]
MDRCGKYVVHKTVLNHGFYARILLCHDPDLQVPVAIKLFSPRVGEDGPLSPALLQNRFLAEARVLAGFDHPYIVAVKTMDQLDDGRPYFVMPYQAAHLAYEIGKDFRDPAKAVDAPERDRPRRVPLARAVVLLRQLGSATLALHRRGMVHRAIKPSNILLTATEGGSVKLCDLSMVKLAERNLPMPDFWIGSTDYTAPEQRENATAVGPRADIYSLGVLAYRLLTGRLPDAAAGPAELDGDLPAQVVELVRRCTAPEPEARPAHAGEFLQALEGVPVQRVVKPVVKVVPARRPAAAAPAPVPAEG